MRVLVVINGRKVVTEVLEFEPFSDNAVLLNTAGDLSDIAVTGISVGYADMMANELLTTGYADLSAFEAKYCWGEVYEAKCPSCHSDWEFYKEIVTSRYMKCPECRTLLEIDID